MYNIEPKSIDTSNINLNNGFEMKKNEFRKRNQRYKTHFYNFFKPKNITDDKEIQYNTP